MNETVTKAEETCPLCKQVREKSLQDLLAITQLTVEDLEQLCFGLKDVGMTRDMNLAGLAHDLRRIISRRIGL